MDHNCIISNAGGDRDYGMVNILDRLSDQIESLQHRGRTIRHGSTAFCCGIMGVSGRQFPIASHVH